MTKSNHYSNQFITPEKFDTTKKRALAGPNGWLLFVACNSGLNLAKSVKKWYEELLVQNGSQLEEIPLLGSEEQPVTAIFDDTETCPRLTQNVAGSNAFIFSSVHENISGRTVNDNIQQLLQVIRTLKAQRAKTITVVTPYIPYSRQDKPSFMQREATLASLYADQLKIAGANMYMTYHPHSYTLHGLYEPDITLIALSGLDLFIKMFQDKAGKDDVIAVSTDSGGAKFTVHYSMAMHLPYAITNKIRKIKDNKTNLLGIVGEFEGKTKAIIIDDETVTGSSVLNAAESLYKNYGIKEIYAAISHMKTKKEHLQRFVYAHLNYGLKELHITDTIPQIPELLELDFVTMHPLARRFAATINRLHYNQSVRELSYYPKN
jgi:ribose-phosphate pyrophosphokinase